MADRRVTECYTANELGISQDRIHAVIHNELYMTKMSARCVPKLHGLDLKRTRQGEILSFWILQSFVTIDETWVHHFQSETKQQ